MSDATHLFVRSQKGDEYLALIKSDLPISERLLVRGYERGVDMQGLQSGTVDCASLSGLEKHSFEGFAKYLFQRNKSAVCVPLDSPNGKPTLYLLADPAGNGKLLGRWFKVDKPKPEAESPKVHPPVSTSVPTAVPPVPVEPHVQPKMRPEAEPQVGSDKRAMRVVAIAMVDLCD
jgi:hypothetical protein